MNRIIIIITKMIYHDSVVSKSPVGQKSFGVAVVVAVVSSMRNAALEDVGGERCRWR